MRRTWITGLLLVVLLAACADAEGSGTAGEGTDDAVIATTTEATAAGTPTPTPTLDPTPEPTVPVGEPIAPNVQAALFRSGTCTGPGARIRVYRDEQGEAGVLLYLGDLELCTHPPAAYHTPDGRLLEVIPFETLIPGSDREQHFIDLHAGYREGLTAAETLRPE